MGSTSLHAQGRRRQRASPSPAALVAHKSKVVGSGTGSSATLSITMFVITDPTPLTSTGSATNESRENPTVDVAPMKVGGSTLRSCGTFGPSGSEPGVNGGASPPERGDHIQSNEMTAERQKEVVGRDWEIAGDQARRAAGLSEER